MSKTLTTDERELLEIRLDSMRNSPFPSERFVVAEVYRLRESLAVSMADEAIMEEMAIDNAKLREYAQHISPCATVEGWTVCTCGLDDALKENDDE